jgi:hypothetical protein
LFTDTGARKPDSPVGASTIAGEYASGPRRTIATDRKRESQIMMKNLSRAILGLIATAIATWAVNQIVDKIFGPDEA